jgi:hypothetical protein
MTNWRTWEQDVRAVGAAVERTTDGCARACSLMRPFGMARTLFNAMPNVELTGPRRHGALAVRPMMNQGGRAARVPCRSGSG